MRTFFGRLLLAATFLLCADSAFAATLLPNGKQTFVNANGVPLAGGFVYFYIPNTSTPKNTYQDPLGATLNTNPITLDASGSAVIYGSGSYREVVTDASSNVIWDQLTADTSTSGLAWGGTSTGSANAQAVTASGFTLSNGAILYFRAGYSNTAAATLNVNAGGALSVYTDTTGGPVLLSGGEIGAGNVVGVVYDSTLGAFHVISPGVVSGGSIIVSTAAGGTALPLSQILLDPISAATFGADPTYATDSTAAMTSFWRACQLTYSGGGGHRCVIPPGHYKLGSLGANLLWDTSLNPYGGWTIECGGNGAGGSSSGVTLDFSASPGSYMQIMSSTSGVVASGGRFLNCGVVANNTTGAALQLGRQDYGDTLANFEFGSVYAYNGANSSNGVGVQLNQVLNSVFPNIRSSAGCADAYGFCGSGGDALQLRQASYNVFVGGSFTAAQNGVHFSGGASYGNVWTAPFLGDNFNDVTVDSATTGSNTFVGGNWQWCASPTGSTCSSGTGHAVVHNQATPTGAVEVDNPYLVDGSTNLVTGTGVGNILITGAASTVASAGPTLVSGTALANPTGRRVFISLTGNASSTTVCYGPSASLNCFTAVAAGGVVTVMLRPSDSIKATWTGPIPSLVWTEAQ